MYYQPDVYIPNTIDGIYSYYSEEDIFKLVFGEYPNYDKKYVSPFRNDNYPNCYFIKKDNHIYFVDWADSTIGAVGSIVKMYDLSLKDAISYIKNNIAIRDINLKPKIIQNFNKPIKTPTLIIPKKRDWEKRDSIYWTERYGITIANLEEDKTIPISFYSWRKNNIWKHTSLKEIGYAISTNDNKYKIYRPLDSKNSKWLSNIPKNYILGKYTNNGNLIITKSYKDYRVIYNLIEDNVIWLQSEGSIPDNINNFVENYDNITIFYDNDNAGINASNKLAKIITKPTNLIYTPEKHLKDISEMYCFKGRQFTEKWLKNTLNLKK